MNTRLIATLTALSLTALAGANAHADESTVTLAWQQPGYVEEVVVVKAKRPETAATVTETTAAAVATDATLAWQEPGYVEDVVIARASRSEVLAAYRSAIFEAARERQGLIRGAAWNATGYPAR